MSDEIYNQVINSIDIADIIGEKVRLRPTHRGFMGLCPFHNEDTPSFHVYTDTQSFYCFGCHVGGNIFTYIMKSEGLNFREALKFLADRAGIKLTSYEKKSGAKSYGDIMNETAKFFSDNLNGITGQTARAYLEDRKLDKSDITRFSLGYSLNSWDSLVNHLRKEKIANDRQILNLGLALNGRSGLYDRFRGRIIFPIKDLAGKIIAFGGRLIDGDGAKYINSPESDLYSKRKNLYLLHEARASIREKKRSILVEGYMDAIRLHKSGFTESVASLGTSLTSEQAELLSRFATRCYICYDSDKAGQNAALRGMYILAEHGLDVYVINIPDLKDPDEFLCNNSSDDFEKLIADSRPLIAQHVEILKPSLNDPVTRKSALKELFDSINKLSPEDIRDNKACICEGARIAPSTLEEIITATNKSAIKKVFDAAHPIRRVGQAEKSSAKIRNDEAGICAMLYHYKECRLSLSPQEVSKIFISPVARETAIALLTEDPESVYKLWLEIGDFEKINLIAQGETIGREFNIQERFRRLYSTLNLEYAKRRKSEILSKQNLSLDDYKELQTLLQK